MTDPANPPAPAYHLFLDSDEARIATTAIRLFISDVAHEPRIRQLGREVLTTLPGTPDDAGRITLSLGARQMKIVHSAITLLFNDLRREQAAERETLRSILNKLPDEHTMHAIKLE
ncbi:MAG: hypothetical protein ACRDLP_14895 [Solirubrobacteraceae bacterium]